MRDEAKPGNLPYSFVEDLRREDADGVKTNILRLGYMDPSVFCLFLMVCITLLLG